jgi:nucleoside-diphosphate-sugar epimerase
LQTYLSNARQGLPLKVFGKCEGKRHYVYVKDLSKAIGKALKKPEVSGVFNIEMKTNYSFLELARTINRVLKNQAGIIENREMKADESIYLMDIEKAKNVLGWKPKFDLLETYMDTQIRTLLLTNRLLTKRWMFWFISRCYLRVMKSYIKM